MFSGERINEYEIIKPWTNGYLVSNDGVKFLLIWDNLLACNLEEISSLAVCPKFVKSLRLNDRLAHIFEFPKNHPTRVKLKDLGFILNQILSSLKQLHHFGFYYGKNPVYANDRRSDIFITKEFKVFFTDIFDVQKAHAPEAEFMDDLCDFAVWAVQLFYNGIPQWNSETQKTEFLDKLACHAVPDAPMALVKVFQQLHGQGNTYELCLATMEKEFDNLTSRKRMPEIPEAFLLLGQQKIHTDVYCKVSANSVLLGCLGLRGRDPEMAREDICDNPGFSAALPDFLQTAFSNEAADGAGLLYSLPAVRAATSSKGPVCLMQMVTGSCRALPNCPLLHHKDSRNKYRICFRYLGTGVCPGPRCEKVHPCQADIDAYLETGNLIGTGKRPFQDPFNVINLSK